MKINNADIYADILKNTDFEIPQLHLPYCEDHSKLNTPKKLKSFTVKNRICYQPMEGQDADSYGTPTELTFDRYHKLAHGGAGIIWIEAVSALPEARSNPHQLMINENNVGEYKKLVSEIKEICLKDNGYEPCVILQLNHSGRHSKPEGFPAPIIAMDNPSFTKPGIEYTLATDEYIKKLPDIFSRNAKLCEEAGLDGVDIKCCHGYLFSEFLSAYDREGQYGGSFENRTRILLDTFDACNSVLSDKIIRTCRLNIYDGYNSKYSFGRDEKNYEKYDLSEPKKLISLLLEKGLDLLNVTMGSPYVNPDVSRPYKAGIDKPKTNALSALERLFSGASEIHQSFPQLPVVNTGVSGLCSGSADAAAGMIDENMTDFVGFGRMSFAYPDLARDIITGTFDKNKCCVACSGCSTLKKNGLKSGCIVRNKLYRDIYKEFTAK